MKDDLRTLWTDDGAYKIDSVSSLPCSDKPSYSEKLLRLRLEIVRELVRESEVLDLCCATGVHLLSFKDIVRHGVGLDFSEQFIERANQYKEEAGVNNIEFVCEDASAISMRSDHFDLVYSFSSLYAIPDVHNVIREISRVLKPGGVCVFDLANRFSLNAIVGKAYIEKGWTPMFLHSLQEMSKMLKINKLVIREHRAFQILPLWGADRPKWLKPLLWQGWTRLLMTSFRGKMLDEWISSLPGLTFFAFRHLFICEKR